MKKVVTTSVFLLVMPFLACLDRSQNNNNNKRTEKHTYSIQNNVHEEFLETFDDFETFSDGNGVTSYSLSKPLKNYSSVRLNAVDDQLDNLKMKFSVDSFDEVGFMNINMEITNTATQEILLKDHIKGYEIENSQICLEYHGNLYSTECVMDSIREENVLHEELANYGHVGAGGTTVGHWGDYGSVSDAGNVCHGSGGGGSHTSPYIVVEAGEGGGGGSSTPISDELMPDIVNIGLVICTMNNAINAFSASQLMQIPVFNVNNPFTYLYYDLVVQNATNHYKANVKKINEWKSKKIDASTSSKTIYQELLLDDKGNKGFITDQNNENFKDIKFGICQKNLNSSGCGIFAAYNSMIEAGTNPDLPSLVMLYELCHADFAGGMFGVLPLSSEAVDLLTTAINAVYFGILLPIMEATLTGLEAAAIAAELNPIVVALFPWLAPIAAAATITAFETIKAALIVASAAVSFATWYLDITPTEGDMIKLIYGQNAITQYNLSASWNLFKTAFKNKKRGIICCWNSCNSAGVPTSGAHYFYITKEKQSDGSCLYYSKNGYVDGTGLTNENLLDIMENGSTARECQFIWGCLFE